MGQEIIKNTNSNLAIKVGIGGLFLIFGLAALQYYVGIVFLVVAAIAFSYSTGIEVDYAEHRIRAYTKLLWSKKGQWVKLNTFTRMAIRKTRKGIRQYGGRSSASTTRFHSYFDVVLLSENYPRGFMLFTTKDKNEALHFAESWSAKLNIPL
jgi:hypothetical protein